MELFVVLYDLARAVERVLQNQKLSDERPHAFTVFRKYSLENCKVELSHLEDTFVKDLCVVGIGSVFRCIESGWLERFDDHVIPIHYFLR